MYGVCVGDDESGASIIPPFLQGEIKALALTDGGTCAIVKNNDIACWGKTINVPTERCTQLKELYLFQTSNGSASSAQLCTDNKLIISDYKGLVLNTYTNVTSVSRSPTNVCFIQNTNTATCYNSNVNANAILHASKVFAGDFGSCVLLNYAPLPSLSCIDSYSTFESLVTYETSFLDAKFSGPMGCFQFKDGWYCSSSVMGYTDILAKNMWSTADNTNNNILKVQDLDFYTPFQLSRSNILCTTFLNTNDVWCEGFSAKNGMNLLDLNKYDTTNTSQVLVSNTHACCLIQSKNSFWFVITVFLFIFLLLIAVYMGIRKFNQKPQFKRY